MAAVERDPRGAKLLLQFSFVSAGWLIDDQVGVGLLEQIDQIGDARLAVVEEVRFSPLIETSILSLATSAPTTIL